MSAFPFRFGPIPNKQSQNRLREESGSKIDTNWFQAGRAARAPCCPERVQLLPAAFCPSDPSGAAGAHGTPGPGAASPPHPKAHDQKEAPDGATGGEGLPCLVLPGAGATQGIPCSLVPATDTCVLLQEHHGVRDFLQLLETRVKEKKIIMSLASPWQGVEV